MRRQIIFDAEPRMEFEDAVIWYNAQQPGLGDRFEIRIYPGFFGKSFQTRVETLDHGNNFER